MAGFGIAFREQSEGEQAGRHARETASDEALIVEMKENEIEVYFVPLSSTSRFWASWMRF